MTRETYSMKKTEPCMIFTLTLNWIEFWQIKTTNGTTSESPVVIVGRERESLLVRVYACLYMRFTNDYCNGVTHKKMCHGTLWCTIVHAQGIMVLLCVYKYVHIYTCIWYLYAYTHVYIHTHVRRPKNNNVGVFCWSILWQYKFRFVYFR